MVKKLIRQLITFISSAWHAGKERGFKAARVSSFELAEEWQPLETVEAAGDVSLWIEAENSGAEVQAFGRLTDDGTRCLLSVQSATEGVWNKGESAELPSGCAVVVWDVGRAVRYVDIEIRGSGDVVEAEAR